MTNEHREDLGSVPLGDFFDLGISAAHCRIELQEALEQHLPGLPVSGMPQSIGQLEAVERLMLLSVESIRNTAALPHINCTVAPFLQ